MLQISFKKMYNRLIHCHDVVHRLAIKQEIPDTGFQLYYDGLATRMAKVETMVAVWSRTRMAKPAPDT